MLFQARVPIKKVQVIFTGFSHIIFSLRDGGQHGLVVVVSASLRSENEQYFNVCLRLIVLLIRCKKIVEISRT